MRPVQVKLDTKTMTSEVNNYIANDVGHFLDYVADEVVKTVKKHIPPTGKWKTEYGHTEATGEMSKAFEHLTVNIIGKDRFEIEWGFNQAEDHSGNLMAKIYTHAFGARINSTKVGKQMIFATPDGVFTPETVKIRPKGFHLVGYNKAKQLLRTGKGFTHK